MDWQTIASWAAGITTVLGSIAGAAYLAMIKISKLMADGPQPKNNVSVFTTDTVAYTAMTNAMITLTTAVEGLAGLMRKEQAEAEKQVEIDRRVKEELAEKVREELAALGYPQQGHLRPPRT